VQQPPSCLVLHHTDDQQHAHLVRCTDMDSSVQQAESETSQTAIHQHHPGPAELSDGGDTIEPSTQATVPAPPNPKPTPPSTTVLKTHSREHAALLQKQLRALKQVASWPLMCIHPLQCFPTSAPDEHSAPGLTSASVHAQQTHTALWVLAAWPHCLLLDTNSAVCAGTHTKQHTKQQQAEAE
jgi:hypothetical protein